MMRLRAKIIFEWEYEADPQYYLTEDPNEAIKDDIRGANDNIFGFLDLCPNKSKIEIESIEDNK